MSVHVTVRLQSVQTCPPDFILARDFPWVGHARVEPAFHRAFEGIAHQVFHLMESPEDQEVRPASQEGDVDLFRVDALEPVSQANLDGAAFRQILDTCEDSG